jgi:hypothetical protein
MEEDNNYDYDDDDNYPPDNNIDSIHDENEPDLVNFI